MLSCCAALAIQKKQDRLETPLKRVAFFWICRDDKEFHSFRDVLNDIVEDRSLVDTFSINTYITGEVDLKKVQLKGNWNQFAGKPDFRRVGKETRAAFPDDDVGVFLCGPSAIGEQLKGMCAQHNLQPDRTMPGPRFVFHKETF